MCNGTADAPNATNCSFSGGGGSAEGHNYWALLALALVAATAAGNILVCLAISWERRLQNVTNYFLMSLAITDLMVAVLVMPLGILTLVTGFFPLPSEYCLAWVCLDVLLCTASIMHLCTISVDRFLSLRYPMRFGRNKTRRRVVLKILFVWLLSIAMSMPLSLMYSQDHSSVLVDGSCQIPDPLYKLIGSIVCFYIPLLVMLVTYALTVRLLQVQQRNLGLSTSSASPPPLESQWGSTWYSSGGGSAAQMVAPTRSLRCTVRKTHSGASTSDTEVASTSAPPPPPAAGTLDPGHLWLQEAPIATPVTVTALHRFGAEMLRLSEGMAPPAACSCRRCGGRAPTHVTWSEKRGARTATTAVGAAPSSAAAVPRNSSRHGRILMLEQKATKVLGVVFFTFVVLWAPFFVLNLVPAFCDSCHLSNGLVDLVTWLGYASSMVNPIFYTVFNKVFRQAFKKVLLCRYRNGLN